MSLADCSAGCRLAELDGCLLGTPIGVLFASVLMFPLLRALNLVRMTQISLEPKLCASRCEIQTAIKYFLRSLSIVMRDEALASGCWCGPVLSHCNGWRASDGLD